MTPRSDNGERVLPEDTLIFINSNEPRLYDSGLEGQHKVILQALNRSLIYGKGEEQYTVFYGVENYEGTEPAWDETPVIFQESGIHPDLREFTRDPAGTLEKIRGKPAGRFKGSAVFAGPGQPRLESYITFSDPEVEKLYNAGDLGLSTAIYCSTKNGRLDGQVRPNHVLLFNLKKAGPRDLGSMFLNSVFLDSNDPKEGETIDKLDKILSDFTNSIKSMMPGGGNGGGGNGGGEGGDGGQGGPGGNGGGPGGNGGGDGGQAALTNALQVKDQENKALQAKNADLEKELKNAQDDLRKFQQAESDRVWTALKNTTIPPGLVKTEEAEKELRELYNTDRDGFYQKLMAVKAKAPAGGKQGEEFTNSEKFQKLQKVNADWDHLTGQATPVKEA